MGRLLLEGAGAVCVLFFLAGVLVLATDGLVGVVRHWRGRRPGDD